MKFNTMILVFALATLNMCASLKSTQLDLGLKEGDMQECVDQFDSLLQDAENALTMVDNRDWVSVASVMPQLVGDMLDNFQCFKSANALEQFYTIVQRLATGNNDTRQCVLNHLKIVYTDLKLAMVDLFKRKREDARQRFKHALDTLEDIQKC